MSLHDAFRFDSFYVAWRYLIFNRGRGLTLVACVTLIAVLPLALELLLDESERQLLARAETTPLVIGAEGSSLDLVMNSPYFGDMVPELVSMAVTERVAESDLALPIPLYVRFKARGTPVVGTSLEYFDFRGIEVAAGSNLALLGECVLGARAAERLGLAPGDSLLSSPETLFDLAGVYLLKMQVVGILEPSHSADDLAVFVDLKTAWIIQGLVHGHADLTDVNAPTLVMERSDGSVTATAAEALVRKRPAAKGSIERNHRVLRGELLALDERIADIARADPGRPILTSHPVYQYLARHYGLNLRSVMWEPDEMPSERQWAELEGILKEHPAKWMLWEADPAEENVAGLRALGVSSVVLDPCANRPEAGDFLSVMSDNTKNLERVFQP